MSLRVKLALGYAPLAIAMLVISVADFIFLDRLGRSAERVLEDNYRSVLAVQHMMEAIEDLDNAALLVVAGQREEIAPQTAERRFEAELRVQERNLTELGEEEATHVLREAWTKYLGVYNRLRSETVLVARQELYFESLRPAYVATKDAAEHVLTTNQDAMVRKSDEAKRIADRSITMLVVVSIAGLLVALYATSTITRRLLRPLSVLAQATRRLGEGDLAVRAVVQGQDEITSLATDFNAMAEHLQKYRESSLGELLEAQRASQATMDSLPDPVLVIAIEGELLHVNRAAEDVLDLSVDNGLGALDPALRDVVERVRLHVAAGKGAYAPRGFDEAVRITTRDGERYLLPRATPVYAEEGDVVGSTVVLQDVTRLLRFEELRNNLVATVAHEFRTPLTSLRMAIHLLTEGHVGPLTDKQADLVYAAREDCERLQTMVDELLDLSRIQAGRMELKTRAADVETLVSDAIEAQRAFADTRGIVLHRDALPGMGQVLVDLDRIELVFANLLTNAIRHSPIGGTVTVRATADEHDARFEIVDSGPGIPKEYQQVIFEKYFQMPDAAPGGAGLGLFIVREIVEAHGGEVGVESDPGRGASFWFILPKAPQTRLERTAASRDESRA